jgi:hypothetical protein
MSLQTIVFAVSLRVIPKFFFKMLAGKGFQDLFNMMPTGF